MIDFKNDFLNGFPSDDYDIFNCFNKDVIVLDPKIRHQNIAYEKFNNILNEYNGNKQGKQACLRAMLTDLLIYLSRLQDIYHDKKEPASSKQELISKIMQYISDNYNKNISLQNIADYIGYSKNYLCTFFKKNSNFSIIEYLNGTRVKQAQKLLKETHMSVTDVAYACGFESTTHFGRVFREISGCSPTHYRKKSNLIQSTNITILPTLLYYLII